MLELAAACADTTTRQQRARGGEGDGREAVGRRRGGREGGGNGRGGGVNEFDKKNACEWRARSMYLEIISLAAALNTAGQRRLALVAATGAQHSSALLRHAATPSTTQPGCSGGGGSGGGGGDDAPFVRNSVSDLKWSIQRKPLQKSRGGGGGGGGGSGDWRRHGRQTDPSRQR